MARPRKNDRDAKATTRIESAFWKLLEEMNYSDITVLRLSQESGTNRNSFYYHYKDIDDLARSAFMHNAGKEVTRKLISVLLPESGKKQNSPDHALWIELLSHSKRIMLCARSDSAYLNRLVKELLSGLWFDALGIDAQALSVTEKLQMDFVFSGLVSVLGSKEVEETPLIMTELSCTEIGKAAVSTLKRISKTMLQSNK